MYYAVDYCMGTSLFRSPMFIVLSLYSRYGKKTWNGGPLEVIVEEFIETAIPSFSHIFVFIAIDHLRATLWSGLGSMGIFNKSILTLGLGFGISWWFLFSESTKSRFRTIFTNFRLIDQLVINFKNRLLLSIFRVLLAAVSMAYTEIIRLVKKTREWVFPMPNYIYQPLGERTMRLLRIKRTWPWEMPRFELIETHVDSAPPYEAFR